MRITCNDARTHRTHGIAHPWPSPHRSAGTANRERSDELAALNLIEKPDIQLTIYMRVCVISADITAHRTRAYASLLSFARVCVVASRRIHAWAVHKYKTELNTHTRFVPVRMRILFSECYYFIHDELTQSVGGGGQRRRRRQATTEMTI